MTQNNSTRSNNENGRQSTREVKPSAFLTDLTLPGKLFRFAGVGAFTGLIYVITVALFVDGLGFDAKWASVIGYLAALPVSFFAHKRITFRSVERPLLEAIRFVVLHAANIVVSIGGMFFVVDWMGYSYWLGSALVVALVPVSTFLVMDWWVFAQSADRSETGQNP